MSRIDDALKRASGADYALPEPEATTASSGSGRSNEPLEHYPRESRRPEERPARPLNPSSPRVVAPRTGRRQFATTTNAAGLEGKLVESGQMHPVAVEQYRRLAATLHSLQTERGLKTLMVTSTLPREGKTLTIANLALTLSESYKRRVLLIDADLRRPSIHQVFGLPNMVGLTDGLHADRGQLPVLQVSDYLSVVPAGRPDPNPMEKLTSERMRMLLDEAASSFDWVLLDAPPVGLMPDAHLLSRLIHGVVFVIAANATPHLLIERAITELGRDCIIGTVLNRMDEKTISAKGYYQNYQDEPEDSLSPGSGQANHVR